MLRKLGYTLTGAGVALALLFGLSLQAAPPLSLMCQASGDAPVCGGGSGDGLYMGTQTSGEYLDIFYQRDGTEYLSIFDDGSDVALDSASGAIEIQDFAAVCNSTCPTGATATGAGDLLVEDALEVDGATDLDGTLNVAGASTLVGAVTVTGLIDGSAGGVVVGIGADPGATCTAGQIFIDTDETTDTNCTTTADNSLCLCTATDTWTALENN